jgi:hypothetical protein
MANNWGWVSDHEMDLLGEKKSHDYYLGRS